MSIMSSNRPSHIVFSVDREESKMPPDLERTKSDEITEALRRLASISSNYHPEGRKPLQSSVFMRVREGGSIHVGHDDGDDDLSSPTVSCVSFTDDDFSLASTEELLLQARMRPPLDLIGADCDISMSSINSVALKRISDLKKKLEIQENTKLELLNQCMRLETELEKVDSNFARAKILKAENAKLRDQSAKVELEFMNELNTMMHKMKEQEREFEEKLKERDKKILKLEEDIILLQIVKNIDPPSVIAIPNKRKS